MQTPDFLPNSVFSRRPWLAPAFALLLTFLVFLPVCSFGFVNWDDNVLLTSNPHLNSAGLPHLFVSAWAHMYTPVAFAFWTLCGLARLSNPVHIWGEGTTTLDPAIFHTAGLVLHLANTFLVFLVIRLLLMHRADTTTDTIDRGPRSFVAAACGAVLFAVHPVQVESVAWVTGSHVTLTAFFVLLTVWLYLCGATLSRPKAATYFVLATFAYLVALLCKPTAAATPALIVVLELFLVRRPFRKWAGWLTLWLVLTLAAVRVTQAITQDSSDIYSPLFLRPFVAADALAFYLVKLVLPIRLSMDYGRTLPLVLGSWWLYVTWLLPASIAVLLWKMRGPLAPALRVGAMLLVAGALPMLGFIPFYFQPVSTVADRYLYLAMLGPAFALAAFVAQGRPRTTLGVSAIGLAACTLLTTMQMGCWRDSASLYQQSLRVNPNSYNARFNLGKVYTEQALWQEAAHEYAAAVGLRPRSADAQFCLGIALANLDDINGAAKAMGAAARLVPKDAEVQCRLGATLVAAGDTAGAEQAFGKALALQPKHLRANYLLGCLLLSKKEFKSAVPYLRFVTKIVPQNADAQKALANAERGDAVSHYPGVREHSTAH